eukprot:TRINITY_DN11740_c0_g3_i1.p1 TRINITY_DN11740_c0_g3~~TRINITY_DN11740_c0_g3_i1.p1  ORF type:complete len:114 (+),score=15.79 TRINITY_DN11740_c0_g3_i1:244-585(+)
MQYCSRATVKGCQPVYSHVAVVCAAVPAKGDAAASGGGEVTTACSGSAAAFATSGGGEVTIACSGNAAAIGASGGGANQRLQLRQAGDRVQGWMGHGHNHGRRGQRDSLVGSM